MADVNAYALSLELTLQDQASEALRGMVNLANTFESQITKLQNKLGGVVTQAVKLGATVTKETDKISDLEGTKLKTALKNLKVKKDEEKLTSTLQGDTTKFQKGRDKTEKKFQTTGDKFYKTSKIAQKERVTRGARETKNQQAINKSQEKSLSLLGKIEKAWGGISKTISAVRSRAEGIFTGIGLGDLARAASLTGLLNVAITAAAKREEQFHTANFRLIGSMSKLRVEIQELAMTDLPLTMEELTKTTIAMREAGASREDINQLRDTIGLLERTTKANVISSSRLAKRFTVLSGNTRLAESRLVKMHRAAKEFGLSGKDIEVVLDDISDAAFFMGSSGVSNLNAYARASLQAAASAKGLGLDVNSAVDSIKAVKDPLNVVAILGEEARNMTYEQRMELLKLAATRTLESLKGIKDLRARDTAIRETAALWEGLGVTYVNAFEKLEMFAKHKTPEQDVKMDKVEAKVDNAEEEMKKAAEAASGLERKQILTIDKVNAHLQDALKEIYDAFEQLFNFISKSGLTLQILSWGVMAVVAGGLMIGAFTMVGVGLAALVTGVAGVALSIVSLGVTVVSIVGTVILGALKIFGTALLFLGKTIMPVLWGAFKKFGGYVASAASKHIPALIAKLGGAKAATLLFGKAILVAGAAVAGWAIGRGIDKLTGFGDSLDRVNKGQGTFWDYAKSFSTPIGWIAMGLNKATRAWREHERAQHRATLVGKETAAWMEGTELQKRIKELHDMKKKAMETDDAELWKKAHKEIQSLRKQEDIAWAKSAEYKKTRERLDQEAKVVAEKKATEAKIAETKKATDTTSDLMAQIEELAKTGVEKFEEYEIGEKIGEGWNTFVEKAGPALKQAGTKIMGMVKEYGPKLKSYFTDTLAPAMSKVFDKVTVKLEELVKLLSGKFGPALAGITEKMGLSPAKEGLSPVEKDIQKRAEETHASAGVAYTAATESSLMDRITKAAAGLTPQTVVTAKMTEDIGREEPVVSEHLDIARKSLEVLTAIAGQLVNMSSDEITALLAEYLPAMAENKDSGLSTAANQWGGAS